MYNMDKNIIRKYLAETFLTEAKEGGKDNDGKAIKVADTSKATQEKKPAKGTESVPGVKITKKVNKETGTSNKAGVKAIEKDMKEYEKPLKADSNASEMAPNKFNYKDKEEETYHDEMEIMNGMEMLQYDRTPDERFKERALEAIEGSSKMGNNPEWANVVEKGWGGDKEFGKNLAKRIKGSIKKRSEETPTSKMFGNDWEVIKDKGHKPYATESTNKTNTPLIKEEIKQTKTMKRLKFKKEFKGVANALRMIPESYRVDSKVFEMTDGNESYKIRWEGSLNEGAAVVLTASDKKMVNEDMEKMKHLFNYKSEDTLGLVKSKNRVDENATFADIYAKTKKLLSETEDIEGQTADSEGEWDDAGITQAADAKKHIQGSVSTDKGTSAPAPKNGQWAEIKMTQAADAKKHVQGSVSTDNGHQAPAPKEGHWDKIKIHAAASPTGGSKGSTPKAEAKVGDASKAVKQAPEATKHVEGSVSTDKGTSAPAPKKGEWEKVKKSATEATKDITGSKKK